MRVEKPWTIEECNAVAEHVLQLEKCLQAQREIAKLAVSQLGQSTGRVEVYATARQVRVLCSFPGLDESAVANALTPVVVSALGVAGFVQAGPARQVPEGERPDVLGDDGGDGA